MNKQRLQDIAANTGFVSDKDITDIKQLIVHFPYYKLPYVVLAKIYFEKEHYLFENALTQAAMRVSDREWLYHYVHGEQSAASSLTTQSREDSKDVFTGKDDPSGKIHLAEVEIPEEQEVEVANENTVLKNMIKDSSEPEEIMVPVEVISHINNISEFLEIEPEEALSEPETIDNIQMDEFVGHTDEIDNSLELDTDSKEIVEKEIPEASMQELDINLAMNLRKHPIYNVEEFLSTENQKENVSEFKEEKDFFYWLQHPRHKQIDESDEKEAIEPDAESKESVEKDNRFNIIDQFIKANPGITRPKKEFFNAENMAKKSEQVESDFVTETLANIYYEQGNIDQAIKAYEKLSLQNPLKQTYFATLIEKIKKEKK